jgi:glycerol-3-phosphate dehydrogenase (NAD(P)+)
MKIAVFGLGTWGFCLGRHLSLLGHEVFGWDYNTKLCQTLKKGDDHPHLFHSLRGLSFHITDSVEEAVASADLIVESVTMKGMRSLFEKLHVVLQKPIPIVITSKGIEQKTDLIAPHLAQDVLGKHIIDHIAVLSGPSFALEVANKKPTAVSLGIQNPHLQTPILQAFSAPWFRVYPNSDIVGVAFGGAMKNVIAIACGVAQGLGLGCGASAALVTRGLHEIMKLAIPYGCQPETLYGLSGLGDLYLTCSSPMSRNYRFGQLLSEGLGKEEAEKNIGMVVEGANTCFGALEAAAKHNISLPITETIVKLIRKELSPQIAVEMLMSRSIKEESL